MDVTCKLTKSEDKKKEQQNHLQTPRQERAKRKEQKGSKNQPRTTRATTMTATTSKRPKVNSEKTKGKSVEME